ncbi:Svp26p [Sugiyamaella lignohabitans]|uniref:Svp26p n=1 Tax=Sugiyamaella lignohabitans TaxID=796027 RepID=A0A167C445_9ASCO|nr:Svp26p [Sugiyamaella lignohabitans]ANB11194.1 Svp26p [Sugiyamaella lignohabitans]
MVVLTLLSYLGTLSAFVFLTMAVASGLYYLSEQVEEHTVWTKTVLTRAIYGIIGIHVLLLIFDGFPWLLTVGSIATHILYLQNLKRFPFIQLYSGIFISSCIAVVANHWLWFRYFSDPSIPPAIILIERPDYAGPTHPPFSQVASFFGICVWLIPFSLFISLSVGDNVLPTSYSTNFDNDQDESGAAKAKRRSAGLAKVAVEWFYKVIADIGRKFGYEIETGKGPLI